MRFILIHKTIPQWEAGIKPNPELIAEVGKLIEELAKENQLLGGDGLRASSEGVRLRFSGGKRTIIKGPFTGDNELPAGFSAIRTSTMDEAIACATRLAATLGDVEIDIRPLTEPWDIGMMPKPEGLATQRYMVLRKATKTSEAGAALPAEASLEKDAAHLATVNLAPSRRGRRYKSTREGVRVIDGPFTESKELIAGYLMISAASLEDACRWVPRYMGIVGTKEVDVREVE